MLLVKAGEANVVVANDGAAPLLHANVIVAVVEGAQIWLVDESKLETHLRVAHEVAILFAVVTDRDCGESAWAGFVGRFDDQRHIRRVLDLEVKAVVPTSGLFEDAKNGLH